MLRMRSASILSRAVLAILLALLLGLRLMGATGYMPAVEHGRIAIVACPDADANAPLAIAAPQHHHHNHSKHHHATCPYASAAWIGAVAADWTPLLGGLIFAVAAVFGFALSIALPQRQRDRPPSRGPPIPA